MKIAQVRMPNSIEICRAGGCCLIGGKTVEGTQKESQKERKKEEAKSQESCANDCQDNLQVFRRLPGERTRKRHCRS
jgi:hypothetical protein